jgi:hypothetical protein
VPGIDRLAVDRGLAAHGLKPDPVKKGRTQGVRERLVKPGGGTGGMDQRGGECSVQDRWRCPEEVRHGRPEMVPGIFIGFAVLSRSLSINPPAPCQADRR